MSALPRIFTMRELFAALRDGYELVLVPAEPGSKRSNPSVYRLMKAGELSPPGAVHQRIVQRAISLGKIAAVGKCADGSFLYKRTTRAAH